MLLNDDYLIDQKGKTKKLYAPVSFGSGLFTTTQLKILVYYKEFLTLYSAFYHFPHFVWGATKHVLDLTDKRSLTQIHQSDSIHPSLWNFTDTVLSFNFQPAHITGEAKPAADFFDASNQILT